MNGRPRRDRVRVLDRAFGMAAAVCWMRRRWVSGWSWAAACAVVAGAAVPPPSASEPPIDFQRDVFPILETSCLRCHGADRPRSGFRLDNREAALRGGDGGVVLVPGRSGESRLMDYITGRVEGMEMPPVGKGEALTAEQVEVLRAWIDQGVSWRAAEAERRQLLVDTGVRWTGVSGNEQAFRAQSGLREGWSGGVARFRWDEALDADTELGVELRSVFNQADYGLSLDLRRRDLGYARVEVESWRGYDLDTGGYYAPYGAAPSLGRDLSREYGRAAIALGLTRPHWPELGVAYEYRWNEGSRSSLAWGVYSPDPLVDPGKAILPGWVEVEEGVHALEIRVAEPWPTGLVEDVLLLEFSDQAATAVNPGYGAAGIVGQTVEGYEASQLANVLRSENRFYDWLFVSGGYLYTQLKGDGAIGQSLEFVGAGLPPQDGESSPEFVLHQRTHTLNGNAVLGPWQGFRLAAGVQSEWLSRDGQGALWVPGFPGPSPGTSQSGQDRTRLDETALLQYDRLPHTVLYAEARWGQEWIDLREASGIDDGFSDSRDFARETDSSVEREAYGAGATVSPWAPVTLDASYRWDRRSTTYQSPVDWDASPVLGEAGNGYPAFIRARDIHGDEVEARLAWRVSKALRLTFSYGFLAQEYRSDTDSSVVPGFPSSVFYPGGWILAGQETRNTGSLAWDLSPWQRLGWDGSFTYGESKVVSGWPADSGVVPYSGPVMNLRTAIRFALDRATEVRLGYHYSGADYQQDQAGGGLPLGIEYRRNGVTGTILRRWGQRVTVRAQYGFLDYAEPTSGGGNDYTAQWVAVGMTWSMP